MLYVQRILKSIHLAESHSYKFIWLETAEEKKRSILPFSYSFRKHILGLWNEVHEWGIWIHWLWEAPWGMDNVGPSILECTECLCEMRIFNRKWFWIEESATLLQNLNEKIAVLSNWVCLTCYTVKIYCESKTCGFRKKYVCHFQSSASLISGVCAQCFYEVLMFCFFPVASYPEWLNVLMTHGVQTLSFKWVLFCGLVNS